MLRLPFGRNSRPCRTAQLSVPYRTFGLRSFPPRQPTSRSMSSIPSAVGSYKRTLGPIDLRATYDKNTSESKAPPSAVPVLPNTNASTLTRWTSESSGLQVLHIDFPSPIVSLYAVVRTEIFNDAGIPHTLEHAIFLGSEQYRYKGVLDTLANRAFAAGTNAWTDQTNTTYTIDTAGAEGFLNILPVYLDHVFYPTLTDTGFTTEVYHINGQGEDAGVVFSEMQGRENGAMDLMSLKTQRTLYPKSSGYRSETGGLMEALRVLTIDQIRDYHASYYLPHNVCLIVCGRVDPTKMLEKLESDVEPRIAQHKQNNGPRPSGWTRPWVESASAENHGAPILDSSSQEGIEFPEADESVGEWQRVYKGVPHNSYLEATASEILCTYLTQSAVSPLKKELVEVPEPYCTDIGFYSFDFLTSAVPFYASSVPTEHLDTFGDRFQSILEKVLAKGIDMGRIQTLINKAELKVLDAVEKNAGAALSTTALNDFLFGKEDGSDLQNALKDLQWYSDLRKWTPQQWSELLKTTLVEAPSFTLTGKPSSELAEKNETELKERIEANKKKYGEKGLKQLEEKLQKAQDANNAPIPDEVISSFPIPSTDSIPFIEVDSARATPGWGAKGVQRHVDADKADLPYFIQFDHVPSNFLTVTLHLFPTSLSKDLRRLLSLYTSSFFSLPIERADGTNLSFEDVVRLLDEDTLSYGISIGSSVSEDLQFAFRIEKSKYEKAIAFARDLLFHSTFDVERLVVEASKNVQNLPSEKRDGSDVASAAATLLIVDEKKSLNAAMGLLYRNEHDVRVLQRLKEEPNAVVQELKALRAKLSDPSIFRISVAGDIAGLEQPKSAWLKHFEPLKGSTKLQPVPMGSEVLSTLGKEPKRKALVYALASIDSTFACYYAKGPSGFTHPDAAPLMVVCGLMNALESFLWRNIRGAGLAYGSWITNNLESGLVKFEVFKSPDATKAFAAAKGIIDSLADGTTKIDQLLLESSKSTLAYKTASGVSNSSKAAQSSFVNQALKGLPATYPRDMLAKAADVTSQDCVRVIKTYLQPLFNPSTSVAAIAAAKAKSQDVVDALSKTGYEPELRHIEDEEDGSEEGSESGTESE